MSHDAEIDAAAGLITIRPARADDLHVCAGLWGERRETYPSIYPLRLRDRSLSRSKRLEYNLRDLEEELADPLAVFNVATIQRAATAGGEQVVGFVVWQKPGSVEQEQENLETKRSQPAAKQNSDPVAAECDTELAAKLKEESIRVRRRYSEAGPLWFLHMLFIDPDHQRQGVGTALIKHGLAAIEETRTTSPGLLVGLTSSPQGQALYARFGFESVYWFRPKLQDLDEKGELVEKEVSWPLMIKRYDA